MRIHSVARESIVDGPGMRYVVFMQGCPHGCPGCHNPQTHDPGGGFEIGPHELIAEFERELSENPLLDGVTISGGEPLLQARDLMPFVASVGAMGLGVWLYTGYRIEEIAGRGDPDELSLVSAVDVLVDGRFELERRTLESRFVGSTNQRIIERPELYIHTIRNFDDNRTMIITDRETEDNFRSRTIPEVMR
ncbi:MAG: anaerobic ribonucleoside-triphosphate reductase activating protein [Synergistaceae bacterium]|jgi:anaerobic ribonucleoside-triphosphate reductase activating protein|nr:anaerobic ribonucleoside-triphosphate reductase activating protein [Synergistaceae bacterium]